MPYEYKLVQIPTHVMNYQLAHWNESYPGWEIITSNVLAYTNGSGLYLAAALSVLARREIDPARPPSQIIATAIHPSASIPIDAVSTRVPRVVSIAAPAWATGSYPGDMSRAIEAKLAARKASQAGNPAIADVLLDASGKLQFTSARADPQTSPGLIADSLAAVNAANPFAPLPSDVPVATLPDRTFSFSIAP